jgi:hypothetical protein
MHKGEALAEPLHALIGHCLSGSSITLVEGEGIHPSLARHHPVELVRFAFVVEPDQPILFQTLSRRSARFRRCPKPTSTPSPPPTGSTATGCASRPSNMASPGSSPDLGRRCPTA